jgi:hypothetical protein
VRNFGVVETDNYGGDYPDEKWVIGCWLRKETAEDLAKLLNDESGPNDLRSYKVVERGYKLQPGFEP